MQLFDLDRHGVFLRAMRVSRFCKKATPDACDVNRPCPASYAGLTRVSISLHNTLCEAGMDCPVKPGNDEETHMQELDFSGKRVLVIGGSSGIGNGIAQAFRAKGGDVHVCGTRASASDYSAAD